MWEYDFCIYFDGVCLFNVVVVFGIVVDWWVVEFDIVSVCFSKGLGVLVGLVFVGLKDLIVEVWW